MNDSRQGTLQADYKKKPDRQVFIIDMGMQHASDGHKVSRCIFYQQQINFLLEKYNKCLRSRNYDSQEYIQSLRAL